MLSNIRVVLVEPTHPGNIGAVARAMKNMGLASLYLVNPRSFPSAEATARASGADDVLMSAVRCPDLATAVGDCGLVLGASARTRTIDCPRMSPRECAERIIGAARSMPVALLFGREHSGLSNEELDRCHIQLHIPTNPGFSSLNIASAVQVIAYELLVCAQGQRSVEAEGGSLPAPAGDMELFYRHLEQVLTDIAFLDPNHPRKLMRRLRRLFNRAQPDANELNILRGILTAVQRRADP